MKLNHLKIVFYLCVPFFFYVPATNSRLNDHILNMHVLFVFSPTNVNVARLNAEQPKINAQVKV